MGALVFMILALLAAAIAVVVALLSKQSRTTATITAVVAGIVGVVALIAGSVVTVPVGNVAVLSRFGRLTGEYRNSGLSWKVIIDTPINMSIRTQKQETLNAAASKDLQDVKTTIATNYRIDPKQAVEIYRTLGSEYWTVFAAPAEQETVKAISATFNAEDMIRDREALRGKIADAMTAKLAPRGIIVESLNIINFDFSPEFTAAIEAKVVAAQQVAQATNQLERIKVEAEQAQAKATGDANAAIARAHGQAEANKIISESLTPEVLQYFLLDKLGTDVKVMVIPSGQGFALSVPQP
jgi:prohibitin 2